MLLFTFQAHLGRDKLGVLIPFLDSEMLLYVPFEETFYVLSVDTHPLPVSQAPGDDLSGS